MAYVSGKACQFNPSLGAVATAGFGLGKAAEVWNTSIGTTVTVGEEAATNQTGQGIGNIVVGVIGGWIGNKVTNSTNQPASAPKKPAPVTKKAFVAATTNTYTYSYSSTPNYSTWSQTFSGYNVNTQDNYSYTANTYHYADGSYNYSTFSASNGYYVRSNGRTSMS